MALLEGDARGIACDEVLSCRKLLSEEDVGSKKSQNINKYVKAA